MTRFLSLLTLVTSVARAQSHTIDCVATDHETIWPTGSRSAANGRESVPPPKALVALLSGTYDVDLVTTERVATPSVSRRRILVVPVDTSLWAQWPWLFRRRPPLLVGTRIDVPRPTPIDSLRRGRFAGGLDDFLMTVDSSTGNLSWTTDPGALDSGVLFTVADVDSSGFHGRWIDGGIVVTAFKRGTLTVGEPRRGYYCARKVR